MSEIPEFFMGGSIQRFFKVCGFYTLEDLFVAFDQPNFIDLFTSRSKAYYTETVGSIRLLKYKIFGEDLIIPTEKDGAEVLETLGFSAKFVNNLRRTKYNEIETWKSEKYHFLPKKDCSFVELFLDIFQHEHCYELITEIRNFGDSSFWEAYGKFSIIQKYYEKQDCESLSELMDQLKNLIQENQKIIEQIDIVQNKISKKIEKEKRLSI